MRLFGRCYKFFLRMELAFLCRLLARLADRLSSKEFTRLGSAALDCSISLRDFLKGSRL
jgi:hypothetical protein